MTIFSILRFQCEGTCATRKSDSIYVWLFEVDFDEAHPIFGYRV